MRGVQPFGSPWSMSIDPSDSRATMRPVEPWRAAVCSLLIGPRGHSCGEEIGFMASAPLNFLPQLGTGRRDCKLVPQGTVIVDIAAKRFENQKSRQIRAVSARRTIISTGWGVQYLTFALAPRERECHGISRRPEQSPTTADAKKRIYLPVVHSNTLIVKDALGSAPQSIFSRGPLNGLHKAAFLGSPELLLALLSDGSIDRALGHSWLVRIVLVATGGCC